jgi:hypothetical protein
LNEDLDHNFEVCKVPIEQKEEVRIKKKHMAEINIIKDEAIIEQLFGKVYGIERVMLL